MAQHTARAPLGSLERERELLREKLMLLHIRHSEYEGICSEWEAFEFSEGGTENAIERRDQVIEAIHQLVEDVVRLRQNIRRMEADEGAAYWLGIATEAHFDDPSGFTAMVRDELAELVDGGQS